MNRRILVKVSPAGEVIIEAAGFQGKGCKAATEALEIALGQPGARTNKPEHRFSGVRVEQNQILEES